MIIFYFTYYREKNYSIELAEKSAEYFTTNTLNLIKWISIKGGAYFKKDNISPTIYLKPEIREIKTKKGNKFTYIDVSSLIREISLMDYTSKKVNIRLTSLNPVNPKNLPDEWEKKALKIVKNTHKPYFELTKNKKFRYMYPLQLSKDCLKCHFQLGLNIGELRGGVSVSIPGDKFIQLKNRMHIQSGIFFFILWLLGSYGLLTSYRKQKKLILNVEKINKKFKMIFDQSNLPMFFLKDGIFIECNNAAVKLFKAKNKNDIVGHSPWEFSPEKQPNGKDSKEKAYLMIKNGLEKGITSFEWVHKTLENELIWTIVTLSSFKEEDEVLIFATVQNITEIKELEKKLTTTIQSLKEGVITVDIEEKILIMNIASEKLCALDYEMCINKNFCDIFELYDYNTSKPIKSVKKLLSQKKYKFYKAKLISKKKEIIIVELSISILIDERNKPTGYVIVMRDITEQEKIEKELSKISTLEKLGQLAGGLAHDFNNLLTGIYGNISILNYKIKDENLRKYIKKIEKTLEAATSLTNKLLTFAKGGEPLKEKISIKDLLEEIPDFYIHGSKIKIIKKIQKDLWDIEADKGQITQVISNLIINAKESFNGSSGTIYIEANNYIQENDSEILKKGKYVKIVIKDSGKGIDKKILDKIFDPFFSTKETGSGLGLSIVYSIVTKHNGNIFVDSDLGKGTTFTIFLPAIDFQNKILEISDSNNKNLIRNLKILLMDDEDTVRTTIKEILNILGHNVDEALNGDEVLKIAKEKKYDLILLDLTVPGGKGGYEIIDELKQLQPRAKIIAISGYSIEEIIPNYRKFGFTDFLKKPFTFEDIENLIRKNFKTSC